MTYDNDDQPTNAVRSAERWVAELSQTQTRYYAVPIVAGCFGLVGKYNIYTTSEDKYAQAVASYLDAVARAAPALLETISTLTAENAKLKADLEAAEKRAKKLKARSDRR